MTRAHRAAWRHMRPPTPTLTPTARRVLAAARAMLERHCNRPGSVHHFALEWAEFIVGTNGRIERLEFLADDHEMQLRADDRRDRIAADWDRAGWHRD